MALNQDPRGPLSRFMRFTTQQEPVLSAGLLAALVLYVITRFVPGLTDDDLQLLGLLLVPVLPALLARLRAWSPVSVEKAVADAYQDGHADGTIQTEPTTAVHAVRAPKPTAATTQSKTGGR